MQILERQHIPLARWLALDRWVKPLRYREGGMTHG